MPYVKFIMTAYTKTSKEPFLCNLNVYGLKRQKKVEFEEEKTCKISLPTLALQTVEKHITAIR